MDTCVQAFLLSYHCRPRSPLPQSRGRDRGPLRHRYDSPPFDGGRGKYFRRGSPPPPHHRYPYTPSPPPRPRSPLGMCIRGDVVCFPNIE